MVMPLQVSWGACGGLTCFHGNVSISSWIKPHLLGNFFLSVWFVLVTLVADFERYINQNQDTGCNVNKTKNDIKQAV